MIDRYINFVFRDGEEPTENSTTNVFVGGSPVGFSTGGFVSAIGTSSGLGEAYIGIAANNQADDLAQEGLSTYYTGPAKMTIKKDADDPHAPWQTGLTYAPGDLLKPAIQAAVGINYAVWANGVSSEVAYARIASIEGDGNSPTSLTIVLGTFVSA